MASLIGVARGTRGNDTIIPTTDEDRETMAKAKTKGKPRAPKRVPFGGYAVCFKGRTDTLEAPFGSAPMPPSAMTTRLWEYMKRHRLAT